MVKTRTQREAPVLAVSKNALGVSQQRIGDLNNQIETGNLNVGNSYISSNLSKRSLKNDEVVVGDSPEAKRGQWLPVDGSSNVRTGISSSSANQSKLSIGAVAHSGIVKKATIASSGSGGTSGSNVERLAPEVYSPLFTMANLNLPRDRITVNSWIRNFYKLHPIVRNAINLHATYPISKLNLKCHDRKVLQFFEDMIEEIDLISVLGDVSLEYWMMGEAFPNAELNENTGKWKQIVIQNPDYILVKKSALVTEPIILLRPDRKLQELAMSNNPADLQLRKQLPEKVLYHIRNGQSIPLDNFNVTHLKMLSAPYDVYGTSIIVSVFKDLSLFDKLRECKFAQADGMVNPITVVKVGGSADGDYRATQEDIEFFRQMFEEAQYDKDFKLITHAGVDITRIGSSGTVLDVAPDIDLIIKNIYVGLMVPPAVIDTESAVYASASIGLEVLRQRYFNFRAVMAKWLVKKIFAPISQIQEFYEYKDGEKKLIVPEIEWNQMNLYDLQDYIANITGLVSAKQASLQTLYRSLGLNYEEERVKMRQESIHNVIKMREEESLSKMTLTELRGLDPEKEIMDPVDDKERAAEAMPAGAGGEMPGGMPGGMPGMPGGGGGGMPGGLPELAPPPSMELGGAPGGAAPGGPPGGAGGMPPGGGAGGAPGI